MTSFSATDILDMFDRCESISEMERFTGLRAEFEQVNSDLSVWEIYIPFSSGCALRIVQEDRRSDPDAYYMCVYQVQQGRNAWENRWDIGLREERYPLPF